MTKLEWNLQEIFSNNQSFYNEINNVKLLLEDIKQYESAELDAFLLLNMLDKKWKIKELTNDILIYGSLMYYKNINDKECIELKRVAENFNNDVDAFLKFIDRKILSLGFEKIFGFIKENAELEVYKLYLHNLFRLKEHTQEDDVVQNVKENSNKVNEQIGLYDQLLRDIEYESININGKEIKITSSNFIKYISSRDRETRKQTYFAVYDAFKKQSGCFASILNNIYGNRIETAKLKRYNSVLDNVLFEENIDSEIIKKLIESVNNNLGLIQKYLKIKSNLLEIEKPHLYDFSVPLDSNLKINYTLEEAKEIVLKALEPLGDVYIEVVKTLFDGHIDALVDSNKHQSLTFSWNTYSFMNFRGAYVDLKNLVHEIGHIVNYYLSKQEQPFIYEDSTIFVGETASIVNEILLNRYLYKNAETDEEKIFYLSKGIENYFSSVFKQTMYTEFENNLYELRNKTELTSDILCERYNEIIKKYYGNDVVYDEIAGVEWTRLVHLYRWSYYPYKYATGLLIASVIVDSLVDKKTLLEEDYIKFLSAGSSKYSLDLLKMINIDLIDTDIIEAGFNVMAEFIEELNKALFLD